MEAVKKVFMRYLSSGTYPGLDEPKRLAIQVTNFDTLLTFVTLLYYAIYMFQMGMAPLYYVYPVGLVLVTIGFCLVRSRYYDSGRFLINLTGLSQIFLTADAFTPNSGFEFYYLTGIIVPFVIFTFEEYKKGLVLSFIVASTMILQTLIGTGHVVTAMEALPEDKAMALGIVVIYIFAVLTVARWQLSQAQKRLFTQQAELVHSANLVALGEMAGGIAHEINNPLQTLSLHSEILKRHLAKVPGVTEKILSQFKTMDATILRIAKMIRGLRDLSRDDSQDPYHVFTISEMLEEVKLISAQRLEHLGIDFRITGDTGLAVNFQMVQLSQVLINILNNAVDAIHELPEKWLRINVSAQESFVRISVTDSGTGIPDAVAQKIMRPFFTTKGPSKGTGLGLSISKSIMEKCGGDIFYDKERPNTTFVIQLPVSVPG